MLVKFELIFEQNSMSFCLIWNYLILVLPAYLLPRIYYGQQIMLGLQGAFLDDSNDTSQQISVRLMSGSRVIDVGIN